MWDKWFSQEEKPKMTPWELAICQHFQHGFDTPETLQAFLQTLNQQSCWVLGTGTTTEDTTLTVFLVDEKKFLGIYFNRDAIEYWQKEILQRHVLCEDHFEYFLKAAWLGALDELECNFSDGSSFFLNREAIENINQHFGSNTHNA